MSLVNTCLEPKAVQAVLDGAAVSALVEMHVTNWAAAQKEDPELNAVLQWLQSRKKADLRTLLTECITSDEGQIV